MAGTLTSWKWVELSSKVVAKGAKGEEGMRGKRKLAEETEEVVATNVAQRFARFGTPEQIFNWIPQPERVIDV